MVQKNGLAIRSRLKCPSLRVPRITFVVVYVYVVCVCVCACVIGFVQMCMRRINNVYNTAASKYPLLYCVHLFVRLQISGLVFF